MLASLTGTSDEHKTGARIFRDAECVFQFQKAMRFTDDTQIAILDSMRVPGGRKLPTPLWQALQNTELTDAQPDVPADWYHTCYCWSVTSMASFLVARRLATEAKQTLFYVQAIDQPLIVSMRTSHRDFHLELLRVPSLGATKRLPGVALFHWGMRMRLTTTIQQSFAVQDVECKVVGFEPDPSDLACKAALLHTSGVSGEFQCTRMPKAIYVKLDDCEHQFLPPGACHTHRSTGHEATCQDCLNAIQPGVFAVKPLIRKWRYYLPEDKKKYIVIVRKQFPLMPAPAVALYSMQGTTADPGMVAYWLFPQRCSDTIKWLIVYVILSRPRSLAQLKSVGLTSKVREIIEQGPPEDLVANFNKLFEGKIKTTAELARRAAQQYGLLPGCF